MPKPSDFPVEARSLARRVRFPAIVHLPIVHAGGYLATLRQALQNRVDRSQRIVVGAQIESRLCQHLPDGDRSSGLSAIRPENFANRIGEPRRVGHQLLQLQKLLRLLLVGEKIRIGGDELGDPLDLQVEFFALRHQFAQPYTAQQDGHTVSFEWYKYIWLTVSREMAGNGGTWRDIEEPFRKTG